MSSFPRNIPSWKGYDRSHRRYRRVPGEAERRRVAVCIGYLLVVGILPVQKGGYQKAAYIDIDCEAVEVLGVIMRLAEGVDSARGEHKRVRKVLQRTKCC